MQVRIENKKGRYSWRHQEGQTVKKEREKKMEVKKREKKGTKGTEGAGVIERQALMLTQTGWQAPC